MYFTKDRSLPPGATDGHSTTRTTGAIGFRDTQLWLQLRDCRADGDGVAVAHRLSHHDSCRPKGNPCC